MYDAERRFHNGFRCIGNLIGASLIFVLRRQLRQVTSTAIDPRKAIEKSFVLLRILRVCFCRSRGLLIQIPHRLTIEKNLCDQADTSNGVRQFMSQLIVPHTRMQCSLIISKRPHDYVRPFAISTCSNPISSSHPNKRTKRTTEKYVRSSGFWQCLSSSRHYLSNR
ncbi:hypothetical protein D3C76_818810 [compost metagenome]